MKKRLFLVGGGGFIGKNLVRYMVNDYDITVYDKYIDTEYFATYPQVKTKEIDLIRERIPYEVLLIAESIISNRIIIRFRVYKQENK